MAKIYIRCDDSPPYKPYEILDDGTLIKYRPLEMIDTITIPYGVDRITKMMFGDSVKHIIMPDSVEVLDEGAFFGCHDLETIKLSSKIAQIPHQCFRNCTSLKRIDIPDSVKAIGYRAFDRCLSLESITIPSSVEYISENAFNSCRSLKSMQFLGDHTQIGGNGDIANNCNSLHLIRLPNFIVQFSNEYTCMYNPSIDLFDAISNVEQDKCNYLNLYSSEIQCAVLLGYYMGTGNDSAKDCIVENLDCLMEFASKYNRAEEYAVLLRIKDESGGFNDSGTLLTL